MVTTVGELSKQLKDDITVNTNKKIQFRDTGIYLQSGEDGKLTVNADGTGTDDITLSGSVTMSEGFHVSATELTASGAISANVSYVELNSTTPLIAATIAAPAAGRFLVITQTDAGTAGHTVTLTAGTYDGTNNVATFNAQGETLVLFGVSATRFVVVENIGSVAIA